MAKYIIDVSDEVVEFMDGEMSFFIKPKIKNGRRRYYVLQIDEEDVSIYTEPDRKDIEDEVWRFASSIICPSDCGIKDSIHKDCKEIFGLDSWELRGIFTNYTYHEAKAKYEAWKKDVIIVGDEVLNRLGKPYIIYEIKNDSAYGIMFDEYPLNQECFSIYDTNKKTGRHFPEVVELLRKIGGGKE